MVGFYPKLPFDLQLTAIEWCSLINVSIQDATPSLFQLSFEHD